MIIEKIKNYSIILILLLFFFLNLYQLNSQHWSAMMDMDSTVIYNSLLIASGFEQEFRDHPAFTQFLINGFIFKLISFFQNTYSANIDIILNSEKIDESFNFYFNIARIVNYVINILLILCFYKLLNLFKIKKEITYFICIILIFSKWYVMSFFSLRPEILSLVFFTISIIFSLSKKRNLILNYFFCGFFLALAMLTKIQVIFLFAIPILLIPFNTSEKKLNDLKLFNSRNIENYLIFILLLGLIIFTVFQIYIQNFPRFVSNKYLDLFFFLFSFSLILVYYLILEKYNFKFFRKNLALLSTILIGFVSCLIFFVILEKVNLLELNNFIFLRITNPIHYMGEVTLTFADGTIDLKFLIIQFLKIFTSYVYNWGELLLLLIVIFLVIKKKIYQDKKILIYTVVLFIIFFINATIHSFRSAPQYHIYYI